MAGKTVSVVLNDEDVKFLDNFAEKNGLSRSSVVRMIIKEWMRKEGKESGT